MPTTTPPTTTTHLLYLHGFRSSPQSMKARKMAAWMAEHHPEVQWWCPQLPPSPAAAWALLREGTREWPAASTAVMGSSLGGFYATVFTEAGGSARTVLINPSVSPADSLAQYIGEHTAWHDPAERFFFRPEFVDELRAMTPGPLRDAARYQTWAAKGDEVLDWRDMAARYAGAELHVLEGGDHALSDFDEHLPEMLRFLRLSPAQIPSGIAPSRT